MKDIIIADIQSSCNEKGQCVGHWFSLAKQYETLFNDSYKVKVAGGPVYESAFSKENILILPYNVDSRISHFQILLRFIKNALYLFKESKESIVIMQYGSPFSTHIATLLGYKKCKLFLIEYSTVGIDSLLKKIVFHFLRPYVSGIICPSKEIGEQFKLPYCVVPDYIYVGTRTQVSEKSYNDKLYDFCIIGRISEEKGIVETARILAGTSYKIIIAGLPETETIGQELKRICSNVSNIELNLDYISDLEMKNILNNSKYALLNYQGVYANRSSGIVFDTLFNGVPVIGRRCLALNFVEKEKIGFLFDNIESFDFSVLFNEMTYSKLMDKIKCYKESHSLYLQKLKNFIK